MYAVIKSIMGVMQDNLFQLTSKLLYVSLPPCSLHILFSYLCIRDSWIINSDLFHNAYHCWGYFPSNFQTCCKEYYTGYRCCC